MSNMTREDFVASHNHGYNRERLAAQPSKTLEPCHRERHPKVVLDAMLPPPEDPVLDPQLKLEMPGAFPTLSPVLSRPNSPPLRGLPLTAANAPCSQHLPSVELLGSHPRNPRRPRSMSSPKFRTNAVEETPVHQWPRAESSYELELGVEQSKQMVPSFRCFNDHQESAWEGQNRKFHLAAHEGTFSTYQENYGLFREDDMASPSSISSSILQEVNESASDGSYSIYNDSEDSTRVESRQAAEPKPSIKGADSLLDSDHPPSPALSSSSEYEYKELREKLRSLSFSSEAPPPPPPWQSMPKEVVHYSVENYQDDYGDYGQGYHYEGEYEKCHQCHPCEQCGQYSQSGQYDDQYDQRDQTRLSEYDAH
ncbi:uncharacterized protein IWZ02DRAFT_133375 [Phyllosticta citriasiana]|uniref:uncharacterized protein n=1 Tax=Phyllosticta citriasiana TaxID=595635 RepID=UPI0030FD4C6F